MQVAAARVPPGVRPVLRLRSASAATARTVSPRRRRSKRRRISVPGRSGVIGTKPLSSPGGEFSLGVSRVCSGYPGRDGHARLSREARRQASLVPPAEGNRTGVAHVSSSSCSRIYAQTARSSRPTLDRILVRPGVLPDEAAPPFWLGFETWLSDLQRVTHTLPELATRMKMRVVLCF